MASTTTKAKASVPSPLPHHRGVLNIPESLRSSVITSILASPGAVPRIHSAMGDGLTNASSNGDVWMNKLGTFLENEIEKGDGASDDEMLRRVMAAVSAGKETTDKGDREAGGTNLAVPEEIVQNLVAVVRKELEACCDIVDETEWIG